MICKEFNKKSINMQSVTYKVQENIYCMKSKHRLVKTASNISMAYERKQLTHQKIEIHVVLYMPKWVIQPGFEIILILIIILIILILIVIIIIIIIVIIIIAW